MNPQHLATHLQGRVAIPFEDPFSPARPIVLECYRPPNHTPQSPVVLVQHGMGRNGDEYRDAWIPAANRHALLIVAITYPDASWPGARLYNDGHVREEDGALRPRQTWSNAIPARVVAMLHEAGVTTRPKPYLWGHSAGGQFVHRLLALQDPTLYEAAGAANAGWYSLPTLDRPYPEGLGDIGLHDADLIRLLATPLTIFAGDRDTETKTGNVPSHEAALAQGPHRYARAHTYLEAGRTEAARRNTPFNWTLIPVPGIGHEGMRMSAIAADYWFDGKMPEAPAENRTVGIEA